MSPKIQRLNRLLGGTLGVRLSRPHKRSWPISVNKIIDETAPYTMTSEDRVVSMCDAVDHIVERTIPGAIVECGVWRGGSMMAAALRLQYHQQVRGLWLYDTFDGVPPPDPEIDGLEAVRKYRDSSPREAGSDWCLANLEDVRANMLSTAYPARLITFVEGKVEHTIPCTIPEDIALLRIDTDLYEPTRHVLQHLTPLMNDGAIIIFDDYGTWQGAHTAIEQWRSTLTKPIMLHRIGSSSARIATVHTQ